MESKRDVVETIEKIEKVLEKPIMVYVDSIQGYRGKIINDATGYPFKGNDGVMDFYCNMVDLVRDPKHEIVRIEVVKKVVG